jgi:hypothetical protein
MSVMLYRPAETPNPEVWGRCIEYCIVEEDAVDAALAEGWVNHPDELLSAAIDDAAPKRRGRPPKGV